MSGWTYAKSGVNIDQKSEAIEALVSEVSYKRQGIGQAVRMPGLFASLIDFGDRYITMATDGVGSKLLIAEELNKWDTVGIDCIAMNVNDTICVNASTSPTPRSRRRSVRACRRALSSPTWKSWEGRSRSCRRSSTGSTCPGHASDTWRRTGSSPSSGIHSNGLTLARKVVEASNIAMTDKVSGLSKSIGEELLTPTEIYVRQVLEITSQNTVHGLVDITGGGLRNILRMRKGLRYVISDPVKPAPIFQKLQELGEIEDREIYQTLNMSMGFTIIAPEEDAEEIASRYPNADIVGRVEKGDGVLLEPGNILYDHY